MLTCWEEQFPGFDPVGYRLRDEFPDRWVRFHTLPGSKRYPDDEADYEVLLARFNDVLGELVGSLGTVVLLVTHCSVDHEPDAPEVASPDAIHWRTVAMHRVDPDVFAEPAYWHVYALEHALQGGDFDTLVRRIAIDDATNVMVVSADCSWIVHPYAGGLDVVTDVATRDIIRTKFSDWLSARPDGL